MDTRQSYYMAKLRDGYLHRQLSNPRYSLRAYARDLRVDSSTLSQIMNGKRKIPAKNARSFAQILKLDPRETTLFVESINRSATSLDDIKISSLDERYMLDESYFKVIAEWEHYALLDLFDLKDFRSETDYFQEKLGLTEPRLLEVLENLKQSGLLRETTDGNFERTYPDIRTTEDARGEALNQAHLEELELAKEKLRAVKKELRDFSSATFAVDPDQMDEAKTIIREFRQKMRALLEKGEKREVYMLAIQFFPLTELDE